MSYQVIARKYRPQRFSDVVGQEHVTQTLARAIEQKRIAHGYIFCGPRGTGKTTVARIFAKCLNCTGGPKVDFDENDPRCKEIAEGRSLDVMEIDGASNNGVEQVRELRETCKYAPASSRFKIYIIDEVHMLSTAAFNALLKTLEEPPAHVKFLFATTDPEKVLPTILSRCQRFDLRRIPVALIAKHLAEIAKKEKVKVQPEALHAIARGAEGAMRDAESTLDQLISFCGDTIEETDVLSMFGLTAQGQLLSLARAVLDGQIEAALRELNELSNNGKDLGRLLTDLLNHFRNLIIFQVSRGDASMLEVSEAEIIALGEQSKLASMEGLTRILEVLGDAEMRLRDAASRKILIEVTLLKAIEARQAVSIDTVLKQLQNLRGGGGVAEAKSGTISTPVKASQPAAKPVRAESVASDATTTNAIVATEPLKEEKGPVAWPIAVPAPPLDNDLQTLWAKILDAIGRASPFTRTYLLEAHPVSFKGSLFIIGFDPEFEEHIGLVDNPRNHGLLQTKLAELGHPNTQFKIIKSESPLARATPAASVPGPPMMATPAAASAAPSRNHLPHPSPWHPRQLLPRKKPRPFHSTKTISRMTR
jgi:DNA polymerase III, subunit gamma and tau